MGNSYITGRLKYELVGFAQNPSALTYRSCSIESEHGYTRGASGVRDSCGYVA